MAEKWGVKQTFENERNRRVKRHFDEFCQDERLADAESYFKVNVLNACLVIIISQLNLRFSALRFNCRFVQSGPATHICN